MNGNYLVFDDEIAPGSSGGPLVDNFGRMVGLSMSTLENESYALNINLVATIVNNWLKTAKLRKKWHYSEDIPFWKMFYKNKYFIATEGAVTIGFIYLLTRNGKEDKKFGKPPMPPSGQ